MSENENQPKTTVEVFETESKQLKKLLLDLQAQVLAYSKANEALLAQAPTPVNLFTRVNMGNLIVHFSDLARAIFSHEEALNKALATKPESKVESSES